MKIDYNLFMVFQITIYFKGDKAILPKRVEGTQGKMIFEKLLCLTTLPGKFLN